MSTVYQEGIEFANTHTHIYIYMLTSVMLYQLQKEVSRNEFGALLLTSCSFLNKCQILPNIMHHTCTSDKVFWRYILPEMIQQGHIIIHIRHCLCCRELSYSFTQSASKASVYFSQASQIKLLKWICFNDTVHLLCNSISIVIITYSLCHWPKCAHFFHFCMHHVCQPFHDQLQHGIEHDSLRDCVFIGTSRICGGGQH